MLKKNVYVVYKREVCQVIEIKEKYYKSQDYYVLSPINDKTLKIQVPIHNSSLKPIITKEELNKLIETIPSIKTIEVEDKNLEQEYKKCLKTETHTDLIRIIKTTYLRNQQRLENHQKVRDKDNYYFDLAEKYLYTEVSLVLNKSLEETKEYIVNAVSKSNEKI